MSICEDLQKKLSENGSYAETLREKILYCIGYLESDDENDDLYNLFTYMLYSEKVYPDEPLVPKYSAYKINFDNHDSIFDLNHSVSCDFPKFTNTFSNKCKDCKYYKSDVLFRCTGCKHFKTPSSILHPDLFEEKNATKQK